MKYAKNSSSKSKHIKNIGSMPLEFKEHALISNGDITIGGNLLAQGPLADIHTNSDFKATKDINTSGKITAFSLDTKNAKIKVLGKNIVSKTTTKKEITALRVSDAILENTFENGVIFDANGKVFEVINGSLYPADINILGGTWSYSQNGWSVRTGELVLRKAVKFETDVFFDVDSLTALKPIYVQGSLKTSYGLNINTGELFEDVLVVDKSLQLSSLTTVGRVHIGGDLIASGSVDIAGNLEIEGSTTVGGDLKLNYLDVVYKAALFSAQEKFNETLLVDSQVFKDVNGKNSIAMFTFVKGYYQLNEQTIFDLLDTNQTGDFEFFTVVLGATIDYASEIVRYDGISPYYKNKLNTINELKKQGYYETEVTEALNLPVMDSYLTFADKYGNKIGTYLMDSFDKQIDGALIELNETNIINAKAYLENKTAGADINTSFIETLDEETKQSINISGERLVQFLADNDSNETTEFATFEQNLTNMEEGYESKSKDEILKEYETQRVDEWLLYNELEGENEEINVTVVTVDDSKSANSKHVNSWLSKKIKKLAKKLKQECKSETNDEFISGVSEGTMADEWGKDFSILNDDEDFGAGAGYCSPIAGTMILRYNGKKNLIFNKQRLYDDFDNNKTIIRQKLDTPYTYNYTLFFDLKNAMKSDKYEGTKFWNIAPGIWRVISSRNAVGISWLDISPSMFAGRSLAFSNIKYDIKKNRPLLLSGIGLDTKDLINEHSVVVIGFKEKYWKGVCADALKPAENWLYVDTTWQSKKWYRFDVYSNYFASGSLVRTWVLN